MERLFRRACWAQPARVLQRAGPTSPVRCVSCRPSRTMPCVRPLVAYHTSLHTLRPRAPRHAVHPASRATRLSTPLPPRTASCYASSLAGNASLHASCPRAPRHAMRLASQATRLSTPPAPARRGMPCIQPRGQRISPRPLPSRAACHPERLASRATRLSMPPAPAHRVSSRAPSLRGPVPTAMSAKDLLSDSPAVAGALRVFGGDPSRSFGAIDGHYGLALWMTR